MAIKAKSIIKAVALDKTITTAVDALTSACAAATKAVDTKAVEARKLTAEIKRHSKKRTTLTKRCKTATARSKKTSNAENRKALNSATKELKTTKVAEAKARAGKAVVAVELSALKAASIRLNAYTRAIAAADKIINRPKKKARKKSA